MAKRILLALGVIWAFGALFIAYQFAQNQRYQAMGESETTVTDTRTGKVLYYDEKRGKWVELPPLSESVTP